MLAKTNRITFSFFNVDGGDAIWIRFFGNDSKWHNVLIDGGNGRTYKGVFGPLIAEITREECIDLWIITHTDLDHIGAVLGFIQDKKIKDKKASVKQFWFNHLPLTVSEGTGKLGVSQGVQLREFLEKNNLLVKQAITTSLPTVDFCGLKITVLSPTEEKLTIANNLWAGKERKGKLGRKINQADHKFKIEDLKGDAFFEDPNPWNGSSIVCLVEYKDVSALLLADSHPSVVVDSIKHLRVDGILPLEIAFAQLSHHGSKANNSQTLFSLIKTSTFVITGNGIKNRHPDKETLVRVLTNKERNSEQIEFVFPSETLELNNLFSVDSDPFSKYNFRNSYPLQGNNFNALDFLPIKQD